MLRKVASALVLSAAIVAPALAADYKIVNRFKMPDGGWDYASSDPAKGRIYWARNEGFTDIIDMKTGKLSQHVLAPFARVVDGRIIYDGTAAAES